MLVALLVLPGETGEELIVVGDHSSIDQEIKLSSWEFTSGVE